VEYQIYLVTKPLKTGFLYAKALFKTRFPVKAYNVLVMKPIGRLGIGYIKMDTKEIVYKFGQCIELTQQQCGKELS